jgi:SAM-dependent methyltransferase
VNPEEGPLPGDLGPLRAQDTLERLVARNGHVTTPTGSRRYPVRDGLIFMGYAADSEAMIQETMEEERVWQGTTARLAIDEAFLRKSAPAAVDMINLARRLTGRRPGLKALELGSGAGWVSWLMARAGFDTYLCDFEANSLYSGWVYEHEGLGPGHRIVADARYAPFADEAFDVAMLKEFTHHVEDKAALFAEVNRVLKPGGLLILMDPMQSLRQALYTLRHPDPHKGHHISWPDRYLLLLRRNGFRRRWFSMAYGDEPRRRFARELQRRSARNVASLRDNRSLFTAAHIRVMGGGNVVYLGEKVSPVPAPPRPEFRPIAPALLRLRPSERAEWSGCRQIVEHAAQRLI